MLRVGDGFTANATGAASWVAFTDGAGIGLAGAVTITDPNGITSVEYGRIIAGIIREGLFTPGVHHIVPTGSVNKNELVHLIAANAGRTDLQINPVESGKAVDRTLTTNDEAFNAKLWSAAGRATEPGVAELVAEI